MPIIILALIVGVLIVIVQAIALAFAHTAAFFGHPALLTIVIFLLGAAIGVVSSVTLGGGYGLDRRVLVFRQTVPIGMAFLTLHLAFAAMLGFFGFIVVRPIINHEKWAEEERLRNFIRAVYVTDQIDQNGRPIRPRSVLQGPLTSVYIFLDYRDAKAPRDTLTLQLFGARIRSHCGPTQLRAPAGSYWCHWPQMRAGNYRYEIVLNGKSLRSGFFQIQ